MNHSRLIRPILLVSGIWALGALGLRCITLARSFHEDGLVRVGSPALAVTMLVSLLGMGVLTWLCLGLNRLPGSETCFPAAGAARAAQLVGPTLLLAGCLLSLGTPMEGRAEVPRLACLAGVPAALLMAWTSLLRQDGSRFWPRLLPALWALVMMILRFRSWTQDPLIIHIAPTLLSVLCSLICLALLAGFPLGAGHRRSTVLFGLAAGVFTLMAAPDHLTGLYGSPGELLILSGLALWNVLHAVGLLRPAVQEETAPIETPAEGGEAAEAKTDASDFPV